MSDLLLVQLREVCTNLEKALPQDADRLKGEHKEFYAQKIPELDRSDLQKVVHPGNLVPRKYLGSKKIFSPNPVLLTKINTFVANPALSD